MGEIKLKGNLYLGEGFIQERRDRFFGSLEYLIFLYAIVVTHVRRQTSNHALIVLDLNPQQSRSKTRFIFHSRWRQIQECEEIIKQVWETPFQGLNMYRMQQKLKGAYMSLSNGEKETS